MQAVADPTVVGYFKLGWARIIFFWQSTSITWSIPWS
jgi:hypothetical protein